MSNRVNFNIKKYCESCNAIFQSSALDNEIYCENCREDSTELDAHASDRDWDWDDIVNFSSNTRLLGEGSCRTSPVFYD